MSIPHLFIEEDRLDAVTGHTVRFEVAEELEEEPPFLWHGIAWLHPSQVLFVVPEYTHNWLGERERESSYNSVIEYQDKNVLYKQHSHL